MFTGIVTGTGTLRSADSQPGGRRLWVALPADAPTGPGEGWGDLELGESIAIDGCCLTLVKVDDGGSGTALAFDVIEESLRITSLGDRSVGDALNLERALRLGDRLGGHYVTGHVDTTGTLVARRADEDETRLTIEIPAGAPCQVIHKGSSTIEGVSLTVAETEGSRFTVALIPHTLEITNLSDRREGDRVNLEMDQIGRWVESLLTASGQLPPRDSGTNDA